MTAAPARISIILPVRNEAESLPRLLEQLLAQDYPAELFEILVADGRSTDRTRAVVAECAARHPGRLRLVDNPGVASGPGRNAGVRAATGNLILFVDGHCALPSPTLLRDTATLFAETGAACLCRPQPLLAPSPTRTGAIIAAARASWLGHGRDSLIYNMHHHGWVDPASSGCAYRREVFARVGFYDESFDACEDVEFNVRVRQAGYSAYSDPRLAVFYQPRATLAGLWRQMLRYGSGRMRLMRKHPDTRTLAQFAPLVLAGSAVLAPLALLGSLVFEQPLGLAISLVLAAPACCFAVAALFCSFQLSRRNGAGMLLVAPAVFATIYAGLATGLLREWLAPPAHTKRRSAIASADLRSGE